MIDTKKYEGHTPGPWKIYYDKWNKTGWWIDSIAQYDVGHGDSVCRLYGTAQNKDPTAKLIADAPLLLAEVERLREGINTYLGNAKSACNEILKLRELIE
tara:strand:+ start:64 stop:363 length:300 start_codon:yes stop_codon:yes gene_type:complete